jgi:hypothetical protein
MNGVAGAWKGEFFFYHFFIWSRKESELTFIISTSSFHYELCQIQQLFRLQIVLYLFPVIISVIYLIQFLMMSFSLPECRKYIWILPELWLQRHVGMWWGQILLLYLLNNLFMLQQDARLVIDRFYAYNVSFLALVIYLYFYIKLSDSDFINRSYLGAAGFCSGTKECGIR